MKVVGWRVGVRVARRWGREVEPGARAGVGAGELEVIFWGLWCCGVFLGFLMSGTEVWKKNVRLCQDAKTIGPMWTSELRLAS